MHGLTGEKGDFITGTLVECARIVRLMGGLSHG